MLNNCNRVNNNSIMTVFVEKLRMRVRYFHRIRFSIRLDSIDTLSLADCKKLKKKTIKKNAMYVCPRTFKVSWRGQSSAQFTIRLFPFTIFAVFTLNL